MRGNPKFGLNYSSGELQMEFTNFQLCRVWDGGFSFFRKLLFGSDSSNTLRCCVSQGLPKLSLVNDPAQVKS